MLASDSGWKHWNKLTLCHTEHPARDESIRMRRGLWIWLLAAPIGLWLLLLALVWAIQTRLLYYPTRISAKQAGSIAASLGATALRDVHGALLGWRWVPVGTASCSSEWLLAHGNGGMALDRAYMAERLRTAVAPDSCLNILEYPGYGAADGQPSRVAIMRRARALVEQVRGLRGPPVPLLLIGESLGTGVVAELAQTMPEQYAGLLLLTPYADLAAVAQDHFPWWPAKLLLRDRFQPALALRDYPGPVQLIVAGADGIIPPHHAQALASALPQARIHLEPGLDHNDLELRPDWWLLVRDLVPAAR